MNLDINKWNNPQVLSACLGLIDLTTLTVSDTDTKVKAFVKKVNEFKTRFPNYPTPASICVYPNFAKTINESLTAEGVNITCVSGCFPASQSFLEVKALECRLAVENGANEIDIVLAVNKFLDGDYDACSEEIKAMKEAVGNAHLKVILETGALVSQENIRRASFLAMEAGADFIKTSTGKMEPSATPEAAVVMCQAIKEFYQKSGKRVGFKPAGGISTTEDALTYWAIVDTILGEEWLKPELFRFGASRLANKLLSSLENETIIYY